MPKKIEKPITEQRIKALWSRIRLAFWPKG